MNLNYLPAESLRTPPAGHVDVNVASGNSLSRVRNHNLDARDAGVDFGPLHYPRLNTAPARNSIECIL